MAAYNKFEVFVTDMAAGTHAAALNADTDVLEIYLSNATPSASLDSQKTDLAEITIENGYTGGVDVQNAATTATGTITVAATTVVITASGGTVGPFQYVVLFNETSTNDKLIAWWPHTSAVTLQDTETFTVTFTNLFTVA